MGYAGRALRKHHTLEVHMVMKTREEVEKMLNAGLSVKEVSEHLKISRRRVYDLAIELRLPYNPPVKIGGPKYRRIKQLAKEGFDVSDIGKIYRIAEPSIIRILKSEERVDDSPRH